MLNRAATFVLYAPLSINHGTYMFTMKAEKNIMEFSIYHFHHFYFWDEKAPDYQRHYSSTSNYAMLCIHAFPINNCLNSIHMSGFWSTQELRASHQGVYNSLILHFYNDIDYLLTVMGRTNPQISELCEKVSLHWKTQHLKGRVI